MNKAEERAFDKKAERFFRSQREIPNGRDFRWASYRFEDYEFEGKTPAERLAENYDSTFPDAPGSPGWFDKKFGGEA